jgi:uncharacterized protein
MAMASEAASETIDLAAYRPCDVHRFKSRMGEHLLIVEGSQVYDLDPAFASDVVGLMAPLGAHVPSRALADIEPPRLFAVSLNVAQGCNMACSYCYADEGRFGGSARMMERETAFGIVETLLNEAGPGSRPVVGFMGGEPLLNRGLVHDVVRYASGRAEALGCKVSFSITTNGTLITEDDAKLFQSAPFAVTFSIDGAPQDHDKERRLRPGGSAYSRLREGLDTLLAVGKPRLLAARATVTSGSTGLRGRMEHLMELGFDEVGFSPVRVSPRSEQEMDDLGLETFVTELIDCSEFALDRINRGASYPFSNLETALQQIHRGARRPLPCGGGAGYLSANAAGEFFTCHRLIDDPRHAMGSMLTGVDRARQAAHLREKHVDRQEPCRSCWARYMCGGGCYHEVERRGRVGCDSIRRWIDFCLGRYAELSALRPEYFARGVALVR